MTFRIEALGLGFKSMTNKSEVEAMEPKTESVLITRDEMRPDVVGALENLAAQLRTIESAEKENK